MPDAHTIEGHWVGFDIDSTHAHRIYWPGKNTASVERNVKFVQPTIAVRIPFPLLPEGEQQSPASQQIEALPSTVSEVSDTTRVNASSQPPSKLPVPTPTRPTTCSMTHANAQGSEMATRFLGIQITRDRASRTISMSQTAYIESIISCFNLTDAKSVSTP